MKLDSELIHIAALFNHQVFKNAMSLIPDFPWATDLGKALFSEAKPLDEFNDLTIRSMLSSLMIPEEVDSFLSICSEMRSIENGIEIEHLTQNLFKYYQVRSVHSIINRHSDDVPQIITKIKDIPSNISGAIDIVKLGGLNPSEIIENELGDMNRIFPTNFKTIRDATPFGGYLPGQVVQWVGAPGKGKSAAMLYEIAGMTVQGYKVLWCLHGNTIIKTLNYGDISIEDLYNKDCENIEVYCSDETGTPKVSVADRVEITGYTDEFIELEIDGTTILCTPDHKFMTVAGEWKEAKDLTLYDEIMSLEHKVSDSKFVGTSDGASLLTDVGYHYVTSSTGKSRLIHRMVGEYLHDKYTHDCSKGYHAHHIDKEKSNNSFSNIEVLDASKHMSRHMSDNWGDPELCASYTENLNSILSSERMKEYWSAELPVNNVKRNTQTLNAYKRIMWLQTIPSGTHLTREIGEMLGNIHLNRLYETINFSLKYNNIQGVRILKLPGDLYQGRQTYKYVVEKDLDFDPSKCVPNFTPEEIT